MAKAPTSYIATAGAARTRTADSLSVAFPARPQALTAYVRFVQGHVQPTTQVDAASIRLFQIGGATGERFLAYYNFAGTGWGVQHVSGAETARTVTVAATAAVGALVEVVAWLYADGSVNLSVSVNAATAATGTQSATAALGPQWGASALRLGSLSGTHGVAILPLRDLLVIRGIHTLATMRTRIGLTP